MKETRINAFKKIDIFTIGFALFAMLFGAGNLIFPPYLGWKLRTHWFLGFLFYLLVDIGFSMVVILVIARSEHGSEAITMKLGKRISTVFMAAICLCIGPAIAIPRVAAITYEVGIAPNFDGVNPIISMAIFFAIVWVLCISKSGVVDIVGKILSPLMVAALIFMIAKGVVSPIGEITAQSSVSKAVELGVTSGYQTMDMMAMAIFAITVLFAVNQKGYTGNKRFAIIGYAGIIASVLLFVVYGGLAYLGASLHGKSSHSSQVDILLAVTKGVLGHNGLMLLGIIVTLACLTTAIGLVTAISEFFEEKLGIKYPILVTIFTVVSFAISNVGTNTIIQMASPVLGVIYPVLIYMTFCAIAGDRMPIFAIRCGAAVTFAVSLLQQMEGALHVDIISSYLPLEQWGFGWILPAAAGLVLGLAIDARRTRMK
ncbi:MAG: branched-chain amino acid transport system II carrier protein [Eubacterium sp.]|nr:branched-chain amino acid transport system II carrier protein [Candidatus Colimonas fimequi]